MASVRLDRFLSERGAGSRTEIKRFLKEGLVSVNGAAVSRPEHKVNPEEDCVVFRGKQVPNSRFRYYMLNKPKGVITASKDKREATVIDLLRGERADGLFPVGRLDRDTEGLLLLTNDGELAHRLLAPGKHVPKTYYAKLSGEVDRTVFRHFEEGMDIGGKKRTLPAKLQYAEGETDGVFVTVVEGKYHQIKRMFQAEGLLVTYLKRLSMGGLTLDASLSPGEYRPLFPGELSLLEDACGKTQPS